LVSFGHLKASNESATRRGANDSELRLSVKLHTSLQLWSNEPKQRDFYALTEFFEKNRVNFSSVEKMLTKEHECSGGCTAGLL
jgi:hypothetical protein